MNFKKLNQYEYEKMGKYAFVLVHSDSCPHCQEFSKILDNKEYEYSIDGADFYELDMNLQDELAEEFNVTTVPHLIFFVNKKIKHNLYGVQEPFTIYTWIKSVFEKEANK